MTVNEKVSEKPDLDDDELEDEELPPFLRTRGLSVDLWPAWAPLPSEGRFYPYFSAHVTDSEEQNSFVTTMSLSDLVEVCGQLTHVIRVSCKAAEGLGTSKVQLGVSKAAITKDVEQIRSDLDLFLDAIKENRMLTSEET